MSTGHTSSYDDDPVTPYRTIDKQTQPASIQNNVYTVFILIVVVNHP